MSSERRDHWSLLARAITVLAAAGGSFGGFVAEMMMLRQLDTLISKNQLAERGFLLNAVVTGASSFAIAALLFFAVAIIKHDHESRARQVHRVAMVLLPLTLLITIPLIGRRKVWGNTEFVVLVALIAWGIERTVSTSLLNVPAALTRRLTALRERTPKWVGKYIPLGLAIAGAVGYSLYFSYYTIQHHRQLQTACYDLGLYDNLFFNASLGNPFRMVPLSGVDNWASLKGHAEIGMYAILPLYMIKPGPEALLAIQSTLLGTAGIPLFLLARRYVSSWSALVVSLLYLLNFCVHRSNFYDFHMQPIAAAWIMWMLYFFVANKNVPFWIAFVFALTAREDISIGLACFGMFLVITGFRTRVGFAVITISVVYFVIVKFVVMPAFGTWWFANIYKELTVPGTKGYGSVMKTLISNPMYVFKTLATPKKLIYVFYIFAPLAFLPLRRTYLAMCILPGFFFTILTTGYAPTLNTAFQYNMYFMPYAFPAAAVMLKVLSGGSPRPEKPLVETARGNALRRGAVVAFIFASVVLSHRLGALWKPDNFQGGFRRTHWEFTDKNRQDWSDLQELLTHLPGDAVVAATENLAPHVSNRAEMYCFRGSMGPAEWALMARESGGKVKKHVDALMAKDEIGLVATVGRFALLKKGADTSKNEEFKEWRQARRKK